MNLDPWRVVWERWSVLAAVNAVATDGASEIYYADDVGGVAYYDHGGTWAHLVPCGRGRGVLFGWDHDYTPPDHRAGLQGPPWVTQILDDPRFWDDRHDHRHRDGGFYAYWYDGATWYYEPPHEVQRRRHGRAEIDDVLERLVANAHARQADHAAFAALFDRADVDVAPAVEEAQLLGIAPGSIDPLA